MNHEVQAETVTITRAEYEDLLSANRTLDALRAAGVDNWCGYDDALSGEDDDA